MHDYPELANVNYLLVKLISLFTSDWAKVINLFYVLTFPLAAISALYVFRQFQVPAPVAWTGSLLFAFAPYHYLRLHHLVYTNYCFIPLVTLVLIWVMSGKGLIVFRDAESGRWRVDGRSRPVRMSLIIAVLVSGSVIYYSFFTCFFLVVAGAIGYLNRRTAGPLFTSWILIGIICAGVTLQMLPTWLYKMEHGGNPLVVLRPAKETEEYGLKIAQLLLPVPGHRVAWMEHLRERYDRTAPLNNENRFSSLGLAGSAGFLFLLVGLLRRKAEGERAELTFHLASLNIAAVLLGTIGGFSSLFAYWVNSQIRAYNRISIFIEFFALFAFVLLLAVAYEKFLSKRLSRTVSYALCGGILILGLLDQTPKSFKSPYPIVQKQFSEDADFFSRVEQSLPKGAMVFQLPFVGFPISKGPSRMVPYDHLRAYLHTGTVKWSHGAITGRSTHIWQQNVSLLPVRNMAEILALSGFQGIYLDRLGYEDHGKQVIRDLSRVLGYKPITSTSGREVFFHLAKYIDQQRNQVPPEQWQAQRKTALKNPLWLKGQELFKPSRVMKESAGWVEMVRQEPGSPRGPVLVGGWAVDPVSRIPAEKLMVVQNGKVTQLFVSQKIPRVDVASRLGESALKSQWTIVLDTGAWESGDSYFEVYAIFPEGRLGRLSGCGDLCVVSYPQKKS